MPGGCGAAHRCISSKLSLTAEGGKRLTVLEPHPATQRQLQRRPVKPVGRLGERKYRAPVLINPNRLSIVFHVMNNQFNGDGSTMLIVPTGVGTAAVTTPPCDR